MVNIVTKINGDTLSAAEFNQLPDELENLVTDSTQTPSAAILDQVSKGIANYSTVGTYFIDSGAANAYVLSPVSPFKAPTSYFDGMLLRFRAGNANTGASTINLNALGVKSIKENDGTTDLASGDIIITADTFLRFDSGNDAFLLDRFVPQATETFAGGAEIATAAEVLALTDNTKMLTPGNLDNAFPNSIGNSGFQKLPNNLIEQWGVNTVNGNTTLTVSLPIAFPTSIRNGVLTLNGISITQQDATLIDLFSLTQIKISNGDGANLSIFWRVLGR